MDKLKSIYASSYSSVVTITAVVLITVSAELSAPLKEFLKSLTGHHWVTKSWFSLIIFALFFAIFFFAKKSVSDWETRKALNILQLFAVLGFLAILGFYIYEFLAH
ncbi:MAG: hypothetical protein UV08_C0016G0009 [Parcubacteria group bacterium GW2011_GWA2_42_18]|nr:MAG: hypothetical protein UV08_C0016G0009 [Parcubacteria group bacterium GW2011_GWA2_42_18]